MNNYRYNDLYLVNDEDMIIDDDSVEYKPKMKCNVGKVICIFSICFGSLVSIAFILAFVVFPLVFMNSVAIQQDLVFTRWNLVSNKDYYEELRFPEYKNHYVSVKDADGETLKLGLWHILPFRLAEIAFHEESYDFDAALRNSNYSVLLYFHGTGEDRSQSLRKYQLFRYFFHVIAFDYRGYGDSDKGEMFEKNIVNDCVQIYQWLQNKTNSPIFVWGHSLGTSLATSTLAKLGEKANVTGLVLESAFTNFEQELYNHPTTKYFKWVPWFRQTIIEPLEKNGFVFATDHKINNVTAPIMFLHAMDDEIVPYFMSEQLYNITQKRDVAESIKNNTELILFDKELGLNHYFIYQDPFVIFYIHEFLHRCLKNSEVFIKGSHQS